MDVLRIDLRCIPSRRFPDFPANNSRPVHRRPVPASQTPLGEIHSGHQCSLVDWISKYQPRAAARKNPGPARRKVTSPPEKNGAGASKGDIASPREIISPFRSRVVRASKDDIATPFPPKRPKSPTGHPGALGKVPQSILQWMFSESISDAFHPGDFPISPRITRGRSAAGAFGPHAPDRCKILRHSPENHFAIP